MMGDLCDAMRYDAHIANHNAQRLQVFGKLMIYARTRFVHKHQYHSLEESARKYEHRKAINH